MGFKKQFEMAGGVWRQRPRKRFRLRQLLAFTLLAMAIYAIIPVSDNERIPVTLAPVERKDVTLYLDLPGVVQAYQTVTVRAQVEGQLAEVLFDEGQDVKTGDVLAKLDPSSLQIRYDEAVATKRQDEAMLDKMRSEQGRGGAKAKGRDARRSSIQQFEATVKSDEVTIAQLQKKLNSTQIISPIDGRTGIRQVDAGNIVRPTDLNGLVLITQMEPISVVFSLPQKNLVAVRQNLDRKDAIQVQAIDESSHAVLDSGALQMVDNKVDPVNGSVLLKAAFPNEKRLLWPGAKVLARLMMAVRRNALVVPAQAVQPGIPRPFVYVYSPSGRVVHMRPVKIKVVQDDEAIIDEGLSADERVVVDSTRMLQDNNPVLVRAEIPKRPAPQE